MKTKEKKEITHSLNSLAKTSLIVLIGLGISKILTYIFRIIAARVYGPEAYGLFSLALIVTVFFISFSTIGLADGLLRYIAVYKAREQYGKMRHVFKYGWYLLTVTSIIAGLIMFLAAKEISITIFHEPNLLLFVQIFSLAIPLSVITTPLLSGMRAFERIAAYSAIFNILQNLVKVVLLALFVLIGFNSQAISISYLAGLAVVFIAAYGYSKAKLPELFLREVINEKEKSGVTSELMKYSWPLLFYGILANILYWIDSFSIGYFKNAVAVGIYNAAVPIALLLSFAPEIFNNLFYPMINRYYTSRKKQIVREISKQVTKWIFAINIPAFVLMFVFPEVVINLLFGSQYIAAASALRILSISALINAAGTVPLNLVSMAGKSKLVLGNIIIASAMNIFLNALLVPMQKIWFVDNTLGINGAALATVISIAAFNLLFFIEAYRYTNIFPLRRKMFNVMLAIIPSALLALAIKTRIDNPSLVFLVATGVTFVLLYVVMLLALHAFDVHDMEIIGKVRGKIRI